jgi:hypothetical protein
MTGGELLAAFVIFIVAACVAHGVKWWRSRRPVEGELLPLPLPGEVPFVRPTKEAWAKVMQAQDYTTQIAQQVYNEAAAFFAKLAPRYGYKILYGPPHQGAPILFIGYQPGGSAPEAGDQSWPSMCSYATAGNKWALSRKMHQVFGYELLAQCCGLNAIFVRAPNEVTYRREFNNGVRAAIEKFCLEQVNHLVQAINPQKIVVIGLATLDLFGGGKPVLRNAKGRVLVTQGQIAGRTAFATLHLSGARISNEDLNAIKAFIAV